MRIFPVASDGWRFIVPLGALSGAFFYWGAWPARVLGAVFFLAASFCLYFFRDFDRSTVFDDAAIYSPGDGRVLAVSTVSEGEFSGWTIVRIFLSVFDGHMQRAPVSGRIEKIVYRTGAFLDARHPDAHVRNEQNEIVMAHSKGRLVVTQIAGLVARRIVCWAKEGDTLRQGQRYGLIRFGSQVDVLFPSSSSVMVEKGQKVIGGKTILAKWAN